MRRQEGGTRPWLSEPLPGEVGRRGTARRILAPPRWNILQFHLTVECGSRRQGQDSNLRPPGYEYAPPSSRRVSFQANTER